MTKFKGKNSLKSTISLAGNRSNYKHKVFDLPQQDFLKTLDVLFGSFESFQFDPQLKATLTQTNTAMKLGNLSSIFHRFIRQIMAFEHGARSDLPKQTIASHLFHDGRDMNTCIAQYDDVPNFYPRLTKNRRLV